MIVHSIGLMPHFRCRNAASKANETLSKYGEDARKIGVGPKLVSMNLLPDVHAELKRQAQREGLDVGTYVSLLVAFLPALEKELDAEFKCKNKELKDD